MNLRNFVPGLILATLVLAPGFAAAGGPTDTPSRVVSYADLNLATAAGQRRLQQRLAGAARAVCAPLDGQTLRERMAWRACLAQALAAAQAGLPATALAARASGVPATRVAPATR